MKYMYPIYIYLSKVTVIRPSSLPLKQKLSCSFLSPEGASPSGIKFGWELYRWLDSRELDDRYYLRSIDQRFWIIKLVSSTVQLSPGEDTKTDSFVGILPTQVIYDKFSKDFNIVQLLSEGHHIKDRESAILSVGIERWGEIKKNSIVTK